MKNKRGTAKWLKVVLGIAAVCLITVFSVVVLGAWWVYTVTTSTECLERVASSFMTISNPLPHDCRYFFGFKVFSRPYVRIASNQLLTIYTFYEYMDQNLSSAEPVEKLIERMTKGEVIGAFGSKSARKIAVSKQGSLLVGKQNMLYVVGHIDDPLCQDQSTANNFIGIVRTPTKGKLIVLVAQSIGLGSVPPPPITIEKVRGLTDSISAFK